MTACTGFKEVATDAWDTGEIYGLSGQNPDVARFALWITNKELKTKSKSHTTRSWIKDYTFSCWITGSQLFNKSQLPQLLKCQFFHFFCKIYRTIDNKSCNNFYVGKCHHNVKSCLYYPYLFIVPNWHCSAASSLLCSSRRWWEGGEWGGGWETSHSHRSVLGPSPSGHTQHSLQGLYRYMRPKRKERFSLQYSLNVFSAILVTELFNCHQILLWGGKKNEGEKRNITFLEHIVPLQLWTRKSFSF